TPTPTSTPAPTPSPLPSFVPGDIDGDRDVDLEDFGAFQNCFGTQTGNPAFNPNGDFNKDGIIDIFDLVKTGLNFLRPW
ncbi:MAG: hypothetical protein HY673_24065, partial [Chloroflexi bacterium]|nr:hypothetical protein [Chloroflexota bacterium]